MFLGLVCFNPFSKPIAPTASQKQSGSLFYSFPVCPAWTNLSLLLFFIITHLFNKHVGKDVRFYLIRAARTHVEHLGYMPSIDHPSLLSIYTSDLAFNKHSNFHSIGTLLHYEDLCVKKIINKCVHFSFWYAFVYGTLFKEPSNEQRKYTLYGQVGIPELSKIVGAKKKKLEVLLLDMFLVIILTELEKLGGHRNCNLLISPPQKKFPDKTNNVLPETKWVL